MSDDGFSTSLNSATCFCENMEKTLEPVRLACLRDPRVDSFLGSGGGAAAGSGAGAGASASSFFLGFFFFSFLSSAYPVKKSIVIVPRLLAPTHLPSVTIIYISYRSKINNMSSPGLNNVQVLCFLPVTFQLASCGYSLYSPLSSFYVLNSYSFSFF